ncbi:MAG: phosphoenolpyruvate synthase [Microthrixaceae bacterium]
MATQVIPSISMPGATAPVIPLREAGAADLAQVGGKGANLGELMRAGFPVPWGFVVTADAYLSALEAAGERERVRVSFDALGSTVDLEARRAHVAELRRRVQRVAVPDALRRAIEDALGALGPDPIVAVRSSATSEDAPGASFAGMHESYIGVRGSADIVDAVRRCWASLFSDRAVAYRLEQGIDEEPAIAVVVQLVVASEAAGVMFTADPGGRATDLVVIEAARGLGEVVVSGAVEPDHLEVDTRRWAITVTHPGHQEEQMRLDGDGATATSAVSASMRSQPVLSDEQVLELARLGRDIETAFGQPQDVEWTLAGGRWNIVQTRPITTLGGDVPPAVDIVSGRRSGDHATAGDAPDEAAATWELRGLAASSGVASGAVRILTDPSQATTFVDGDVLVAPTTSPDWVPLLRRAAAVVTESGGATCHAAIVSRELRVPCVVGVRGATTQLRDGQVVTVDGVAGTVRPGAAATAAVAAGAVRERRPSGSDTPAVPEALATRIEVNLGVVGAASAAAALPVDGVGLLRAEVMLVDALGGVHPAAMIARGESAEFVGHLADALLEVTTAFGDRPVVYRSTDFRSNEFRGLQGGDEFEPVEANPMIGFRGCFRYVQDPTLFNLELEAMARVREQTPNLHLMIPFVRSAWELERCLELVDASPLARQRGLLRWVMAEVPSVIYQLDAYAALGIDGVSIGSNDLTQLMLGVDRDSALCAEAFDSADPAVLAAIRDIISGAHAAGMTASLCGQAPSNDPQFAEHLVRAGIDSISVTPDAVGALRAVVGAVEHRIVLESARLGTL